MTGKSAWIVLAATVIALDALAPEGETLSEATYRARKKYPILVWAAVGATALHLLAGDHPDLSRADVYKLFALGVRAPRKMKVWR